MFKFSRKLLSICTNLIIANTYAVELPMDVEESRSSVLIQSALENDSSILAQDQEIKLDRNAFISPWNYTQDPIALNFGYDTKAESTGTYHGGISSVIGMNSPVDGPNRGNNSNVTQIWGQTEHWNGFALGGGATAVVNFKQTGDPNIYGTTGMLAPTQAYLNYQYANKLDVFAGNILITTPWVNSFPGIPGTTYAVGNNSYQGVLANIQALPSLLITTFTAWGYLQYPNSWIEQQTYYNNSSGPLSGIGATSTYGPSAVGLIWNPVQDYTGELWLYNFADYAKMAYIENAYHLPVSTLTSFDFGLQAYTQSSSGSAITNQVSLPGQTTPAGMISSNGLGLKIAFNVWNNVTSVSFNNIFENNGSFLNGGMVTPYTYGMETDPLYTTPALTSLAELGSGYAYTIRNSTAFLEKSLKFNLSMSQFFVNQVYSAQPNQVTEYDAALLYRIPHTNMNVWSRMVYVEQPDNSGGSLWQPRFIFNWTY